MVSKAEHMMIRDETLFKYGHLRFKQLYKYVDWIKMPYILAVWPLILLNKLISVSQLNVFVPAALEMY